MGADPKPRAVPKSYRPIDWEVRERRYLAMPEVDVLPSLATALDSRHSERAFALVPEVLLGALLWHAARTRETAPSSLGFPIEHRAAPSAGGIHPVHLIVQLDSKGGWARYNPEEHSLDVLAKSAGRLQPLVAHAEQVLSRGDGHLVLFVAEVGKTAAKYEDPESLIWRDAGILQGCLALVAAGLGLNCCLLGITGSPWVNQLSDQGELLGVGVAILGAKP